MNLRKLINSKTITAIIASSLNSGCMLLVTAAAMGTDINLPGGYNGTRETGMKMAIIAGLKAGYSKAVFKDGKCRIVVTRQAAASDESMTEIAKDADTDKNKYVSEEEIDKYAKEKCTKYLGMSKSI